MTDIRYVTNRELHTAYTAGSAAQKYAALAEMAKRINRVMITDDVPGIFEQYKLNGAGDERY